VLASSIKPYHWPSKNPAQLSPKIFEILIYFTTILTIHFLSPSGERIEGRGRGIFITPHPDLLPSKGEGTFMR
jgi:hypothetical protein